MDYEQRMQIIRGALVTFLNPYSPPRNTSEEAQREMFANLCEGLNRHIADLPPEGFKERLARVFCRVRDAHKTWAWPMQSEFVEAARAIGKQTVEASEGTGEEPPHVYEMVRDWWRRFHDPMPSTARAHHADKLVRERVATYGQLNRAGFPLSESGWRTAQDNPEPHPRGEEIMEKLEAISQRMAENRAPRGGVR